MADERDTLDRGWWIAVLRLQPDGLWDVGVQFKDGATLQLSLVPTRDLDLVIAQAVDAHLRSDVRATPRRDRTGPA